MHNIHLVVVNAKSINEGVNIVEDALTEDNSLERAGGDYYSVVGAVDLTTFQSEMYDTDRYKDIVLTQKGVEKLICEDLFGLERNRKLLKEAKQSITVAFAKEEFWRIEHYAKCAAFYKERITIAAGYGPITIDAIINNGHIETAYHEWATFGLTRLGAGDNCRILVVLDVHS